MNAFLRRNACPSLAAPMRTGDGLLVRLNTISGTIPAAALAAIAEAAERHGNGILEVTRRGSLQIRGLTAESSIALARYIEALGIDLRTGVPVEIGPLAGLDPQELADPRPLAERIRALIRKTGLAAGLGPKVSVVIDGGDQLSMGDVLADVRLTAINDDGGIRWQIAVGGTAETARIVGNARERDAAYAVIGLLQAIAARGPTSRATDLSEAELAAVSVTKGEKAPPRNPNRSTRHSVGRFLLKQNRIALGIGLPFGQAGAGKLNTLAQTAEQHGISEFRLAPGRAFLAICDSAATADAVSKEAVRLGFVTDPADARLRVVACAGAPACASAHLAARQIATELAATPELGGSTVHVSGCEKRCAEPEAPQFTILGMPGGARILEGRGGTELAFVAGEEAAVALRRVLGGADVGGGSSYRPLRRLDRKAG